MPDAKKQNYLHGASILAVGVIVMKILGAIYKIPIGNLLGDEGNAYFLAAYNVYNVFLTVATAGFPVVLSRLIAEAITQNRPMQVRRTFHVALMTFLVLGIVSALIMYFFPVELAAMLSRPEAAQSIQVLAPGIFLVCLASAYRGYCQGHENMVPTTIGQVLEVLVKVIVGLALAWYLLRAGRSLPIASAGTIFGVTAGGLAMFIYMFTYKTRHYKNKPVANPDVPDSRWKIFKSLVRIGLPITVGASSLVLINFIDTMIINNRLQTAAGFSDTDSAVLYGVFGKAQTLYNLPASFITALTISIVPAIAAAMVLKKGIEASRIAENSLRIAAVVALPMGVGLTVLANPIMNTVYTDSHASGAAILALFGIPSFFVCMALVMNSILQAHGNERCTIYSMVAGGLVKIAVNWVLVGNPDVNILGAPIGTLCCYVVMCGINYFFLCRHMEQRPRLRLVLLRPLLCSALMGAAAWGVYGLAARLLASGGELGRLTMLIAMVFAIGVAAVLYLVLIILMRAITLEDMQLIPKGEKLARLLHIRSGAEDSADM